MNKSNLRDCKSIVSDARNSLGKYCIDDCKAYCCRNGFLILYDYNVDLVTHDNKNKLIKNGRLNLVNIDDKKYDLMKSICLDDQSGKNYFKENHGSGKKFSLSLKENCPSLKDDFFCSIYLDEKRPVACKEFPIMHKNIDGKDIIVLSTRCLAVKENKLYPFVKELEATGCRVIECDSFLDFVMNS